MREQSFTEMLSEYGGESGLDPDDVEERKKLLSQYKHSIIVEGEYSEFDNLFTWIKINMGESLVVNIFYGKTGYDFGFAEFFTNDLDNVIKLSSAIPNIYTIYPKAYPTKKILGSVGYDKNIDYDPANKNAILYDGEKS